MIMNRPGLRIMLSSLPLGGAGLQSASFPFPATLSEGYAVG